MKRMALIAASLSTALLCVGCSIRSEVDRKDVEEIAKDLSYFKDKHGICYAAIKNMGHGGYYNTAITTVPCEKVRL